jgi:hypothetical protein
MSAVRTAMSFLELIIPYRELRQDIAAVRRLRFAHSCFRLRNRLKSRRTGLTERPKVLAWAMNYRYDWQPDLLLQRAGSLAEGNTRKSCSLPQQREY